MTQGRNRQGRMMGLVILGMALSMGWSPAPTIAQEDAKLTIGVAANFTGTMQAIAAAFEDQTDRRVTLTFASTGTLYAQLVNGAPLDAFFAADAERPRKLDEDGAIVHGSRFTYAIGQSVLWSADGDLVDRAGDVLERGRFRRLALADPRLAPYGEAARQVMIERGVWDELQPKLVFPQNVNQAHQFIATGNAELGFIALSQVIDPATGEVDGSHWLPPRAMYDPIHQQAVILKRTDRRELAKAFMAFVRSEQGAEIIRDFGYAVPVADDASSD